MTSLRFTDVFAKRSTGYTFSHILETFLGYVDQSGQRRASPKETVDPVFCLRLRLHERLTSPKGNIVVGFPLIAVDCQAVNPCDNLYHHVCDGSGKTKQGISRRRNGLLDALTQTFNGTRAYGFERILNATVFSTIEGSTTKFYVLNGKIDSTRKAVLHHANSTDEIKNDFVRGIFKGFFAEFPKVNYGNNPTHESFYYHELEAKTFKDAILAPTSWEKNKLKTLMRIAENMPEKGSKYEYNRYYELLGDPTFAGYGNVLFALKLSMHAEESLEKEIKDMKQRIVDEIADRVRKASSMSPPQRDSIIDYLKRIHVIVGVEKKYENRTMLNEMLNFYHEEFKKVPSGEDDQCEFEMLVRAHGRARHNLIYSDYGSMMPVFEKFQFEASITDPNVELRIWPHVTQIHLYPGFVNAMRFHNSTGAKYGTAGWAIAHNILRGLVTSSREQVKEARETSKIKAAFKCYAQFYEEPQFCIEEDCPHGASKANFGFADVEAARIAFSILQKDLNGEYARNRRDARDSVELALSNLLPPGPSEKDTLLSGAPTAGWSEQQSFFHSLQTMLCGILPASTKDQKKWMDRNPRMRPNVRVNAVAQQMKEFTEAFGCQKDQKNYVAKKQCGIFTSRHDDPSSQAVTRTAASEGVTQPAATSQAPSEVLATVFKLYMCVCLYNMLARGL
uniref:Peptidase_M13 domain-containing protein n=1 Tax=Steinernema glaseri TaxID=37863 RepID=A0A1I7ZXB7_9BILA